ncbi:peptide deformylase [Chelatococcus asaccharovorans]|uniref:Peptide deformylase-like n=1 Tax=Chelatococcus asaccharovorans TaxID=28210 RepID=A0A2V3UD40_9HYPH|nr:peptide deformylase [Chelatococcus asaccharovorans]MBS7706957.1 peptide deformylase [Chelatococcus asaccharovorans]PXW63136.1 peptide deformylase [Chelatococcus asaccharovorans]CAH1653748.1 Peptide deformylase-like [Chelatococcus asaccharovorans]CAH1694303.1 Peptide deformylase-like [Chelatococcus asaccharovorans]
MTARAILRYPDPRLRQLAAPVVTFDAALRGLADDVADTLEAAAGLGLTAPHIGVLQRVVVVRLQGDPAPRIYVNPVITEISETLMRHEEGSLSMPGVRAEVERPRAVVCRYQDLDGHEQTEQAEGLLAICLQHEVDQLDGIFWLQRLSRLKRDRLIKQYDKLHRLS